MRFPLRDFTDQYISASYQDVLQQHISSNVFYVLDGYGNVVFSFLSSSIGQSLITSDITSSMSVATASYAISQSYIINYISSASWASSSITSTSSLSSDFAVLAGDAITATTASYLNSNKKSLITITGSFNLTDKQNTIICNPTSSMVLTLPSASAVESSTFVIKNVSDYNIVISSSNSEYIDDVQGYNLSNKWDRITIQSFGSGWYIL